MNDYKKISDKKLEKLYWLHVHKHGFIPFTDWENKLYRGDLTCPVCNQYPCKGHFSIREYHEANDKQREFIKQSHKSNLITWGNNHKRYVIGAEKTELIAYEKTFYFDDVRVNGVLVKR